MIKHGEFGFCLVSLSAIALPPKSGQPPTGLILVLHGWGANAEDVAFLCSLLDFPNYQFCLPDAPHPHPHSSEGKMWYDLSDNLSFQSDVSSQPDLRISRKLLTEWILSLESITGVPLSRTILGGFSQGGAMTLDVGLQLPLAGLMVLSGYLHGAIDPQPSYPPILMAHGHQDMVVPIEAARLSRDRLLTAGATIDYKEFEMGHEISPLVLTEMQKFIETVLP